MFYALQYRIPYWLSSSFFPTEQVITFIGALIWWKAMICSGSGVLSSLRLLSFKLRNMNDKILIGFFLCSSINTQFKRDLEPAEAHIKDSLYGNSHKLRSTSRTHGVWKCWMLVTCFLGVSYLACEHKVGIHGHSCAIGDKIGDGFHDIPRVLPPG